VQRTKDTVFTRGCVDVHCPALTFALDSAKFVAPFLFSYRHASLCALPFNFERVITVTDYALARHKP